MHPCLVGQILEPKDISFPCEPRSVPDAMSFRDAISESEMSNPESRAYSRADLISSTEYCVKSMPCPLNNLVLYRCRYLLIQVFLRQAMIEKSRADYPCLCAIFYVF